MADETVVAETNTTPPPVPAAESTTSTTTRNEAPARSENMVPQSVVDRVTGEKWEALRAREESERKLAAAQATIEELGKIARGDEAGTTEQPATRTAAPPAAKPLSAEELQRLVAQESDRREFDQKCNASVDEGRKVHSDFNEVVLRDLRNLSPVFDPVAQAPSLPRTLIEAALETGEAHEILYALGKDTKEAERIMRLPPIKQAVEVAKFHSKIVAARQDDGTGEGEENAGEEAETAAAATPLPNVSRAPAPVRSGTGRATGTVRPAFDVSDTNKSSMSEWMKRRQDEVAKKKNQGARIR